MTQVIYKYQLDVGRTSLALPEIAELLDVQRQRGELCAWFLLDGDDTKSDTVELQTRTFLVIGTGHEIDDGYRDKLAYIRTFQAHDGIFVGHVFEVLP